MKEGIAMTLFAPGLNALNFVLDARSDEIVHRIHMRVLQHVKQQAETASVGS